ncbi:ABC transporter family substrate-binding protein [Aestuariimicrobium ganziense]|uniref:ABC transporter family substrate-binding protein n=1 Tax=Aestuariimicrobium ganziense TaxID=2773677 RepID=UPI001943E8FC|nr:ABC transporter family substrate-binding protein [Aestuariimicrobium ganziense]
MLWNQYFYSLNNNTSFGNNVTNANIAYSVSSGVWHYNKELEKEKDDSFGTYEKTSDSPLTVKQTIADTAQWSDGVPVRACDYILAYGASSTLFNTLKTQEEIAGASNEDGTMKKQADGVVYFDSSSEAWKLITEFPQISDDGKEITYKYSSVYADWEYALFGTGVPAHVVGKRALGVADPTAACDAVLKAFQDKDNSALSKIANVWNTDYNFTSTPADAELLVSNGPYVIKDIVDEKSLTMTANTNYKGKYQPKIKDVTVVYNEDPTASAQALKNGDVAIIQPQATADLLQSLQGDDKLEVLTGDQAVYEHIDLTMNNGGPFDPKTYGGDAAKALKVRQAFLKTIPRQQIVDSLIKPLNPNATIRNSYNMTPGTPDYDSTIAGNGMNAYDTVDVEGAKALLQEAGVSGTVKVRFLYAKTNPRRQQEYRLVAESAKAAGFEVQDAGDPKWSERLGSGSYDASLFAWSQSNDSLGGSAANYTSTGQNNYSGYKNEQVDKWWTELNQSTDKAKQVEINTQIEKQLMDDAFGIILFQHPDITAFDKTKVSNVSTIPFNPNYYWNIWEWELVK